MLVTAPNQQEFGEQQQQQEGQQMSEEDTKEQQLAGGNALSRAGSLCRLQLLQSPVVECPYTLDWEGTPSEDRLLTALGLSHALAKARALQESGL
jgi:hypothetical protein